VQTFPGPGEKSRISTNGGTQARWRRDARELFYLAPPQPLFLTRIWNSATELSGKQEYARSNDGQRFLMRVESADAVATPIRVVRNWTGSPR